jgi:ParB-like chromosome segregation protein Spo0J
MFEWDLVVAIVLMSLLFLRHITVYKDPNKINYTPVVLALGFVSGFLHFVMLGDTPQWLLVLREALLSVSLGIVLSAIMGVMSQSQRASQMTLQIKYLKILIDDLNALVKLITTFDGALGKISAMESSTHEQLKNIFREEIEALGSILNNQKFFIQKVESVLAQQQLAQEKFEVFTTSELPSLDNIVHRHIDLLRIAQQEHFNHIKQAMKQLDDAKEHTHTELSMIHNTMQKLPKNFSNEGLIQGVENELSKIVADFAHDIGAVGSKAQSIVMTLLENEAILKGSREQSEMIMQQMVLSSNNMREMNHTTKELALSLRPIIPMLESAQMLLTEFTLAKNKLSEIVVTLESYEKHDMRELHENLENIANTAIAHMGLFVENMAHYEKDKHTVSPQEVQELSQKVKLQQSYKIE